MNTSCGVFTFSNYSLFLTSPRSYLKVGGGAVMPHLHLGDRAWGVLECIEGRFDRGPAGVDSQNRFGHGCYFEGKQGHSPLRKNKVRIEDGLGPR